MRVELPSTVTSLGEGVFRDCAALEEIVYGGTQSAWDAIDKGDGWDSGVGDDCGISCAPDIIWGDATGDGVVNGRDLVLLRQYLTKFDYDTESSTVKVSAGCDANGDGEINGRDLVLLRQYLTKFDYDTGESTVVLGPRA